ncbi:MAG: hypothetical protein KJ698_13720, partial [Actinobacteria bacterium]|nr:hypothetical protein [Actinomycetota bacterium]
MVGALVSRLIARTEARQARLKAKAAQQAAQDAADSSSNAEDSAPTGEPSEPGVSGEPAPEQATEQGADSTEQDAPKKGHGRNGADAFNGMKIVHALAAGILGAICAACGVGRISRYRTKVIIRVIGQSLFGAVHHAFEQGRCRLCGAIITAEGREIVRDGIGTSYITYDWSACAMLIVMHYFAGAPFKRLEALHQGWGVPMPDANQWRIVDECDDLLAPLYNALESRGIQNATALRIDDTGSMIIDTRRAIRQEIQVLEQLGESTKHVRTGINATGVYLEVEGATVVLFFTGNHH